MLVQNLVQTCDVCQLITLIIMTHPSSPTAPKLNVDMYPSWEHRKKAVTVSKEPQTVLVVGTETPEAETVSVATSLPLPTKAPLLLSPLLSIRVIPVSVTA